MRGRMWRLRIDGKSHPVVAAFQHERLLRSNIGEVIKEIVDDEAFPDYAMPKKNRRTKKAKT